MAALLRVDGVSKHFGALKAVDNLSFDVAKGEALGILGPNGAGKSTLFNLISGDIRPSARNILLRGRDITRLPPYKRCRRMSWRRQVFLRVTARAPVTICPSMRSTARDC